MLDLRELGFSCFEGDGAEAVEVDRFEGVAVEAKAYRVVEEEANNVVMGDEAENEGLIMWPMVTVAEGCQVEGSFMDERVERVEAFGLAEGWHTREGRAGRDKGDEADVRQTMESSLEMREKIKDEAGERHIGERKRDEAERGLLVAERIRACTKVVVLNESLGHGSSSDSEGDETEEGRFWVSGAFTFDGR